MWLRQSKGRKVRIFPRAQVDSRGTLFSYEPPLRLWVTRQRCLCTLLSLVSPAPGQSLSSPTSCDLRLRGSLLPFVPPRASSLFSCSTRWPSHTRRTVLRSCRNSLSTSDRSAWFAQPAALCESCYASHCTCLPCCLSFRPRWPRRKIRTTRRLCQTRGTLQPSARPTDVW